MSFQKIVDKVVKLGRPVPGELSVPAPELVAFFVCSVRSMRQWKKGTLASFAGVSLSTVERVERGEQVSVEYIDRIAIALGYEMGYLTSPRAAKTDEEGVANLDEVFGEMQAVSVRPLRTERQVRELAQCHAFLPHRPGVEHEFDEEIYGLVEWLDLASFILGESATNHRLDKTPRRRLYRDILDHVENLERLGMTVLAGMMDAPQPGIPEWKMAVVSFSPRATDPGAAKRRVLLVDRRCVAMRPNFEDGPIPREDR